MCKECVKEQVPNRGTTCLESGCLLTNYNGCTNCKKYDVLGVDQLVVHKEDDESEETIRFFHVCKQCNHQVAEHIYTFEVRDEYQEYTMQCRLCGQGSDSRSVMPDDPRQAKFF